MIRIGLVRRIEVGRDGLNRPRFEDQEIAAALAVEVSTIARDQDAGGGSGVADLRRFTVGIAGRWREADVTDRIAVAGRSGRIQSIDRSRRGVLRIEVAIDAG